MAIFGAGQNGIMLTEFLKCNGILVDCYIDNNKQKLSWNSLPVITPERLLKEKELYCVLNPIETDDKDKVDAQLEILKFPLTQYMRVFPILKTQYFPEDILKAGSDEVFIDAGSLDLADTFRFVDWCGGCYKRVYAFEPDRGNYSVCEKRLGDAKNIELIQAALWNQKGVLNFNETGWGDAGICAKGEYQVQTVALDEMMIEEKITFIKMDIEGAELSALQGAESIIVRDKPNLAICIYHKDEDLIQIPEYILSLVSEYRLYIRHYTLFRCETILYAVL